MEEEEFGSWVAPVLIDNNEFKIGSNSVLQDDKLASHPSKEVIT